MGSAAQGGERSRPSVESGRALRDVVFEPPRPKEPVARAPTLTPFQASSGFHEKVRTQVW